MGCQSWGGIGHWQLWYVVGQVSDLGVFLLHEMVPCWVTSDQMGLALVPTATELLQALKGNREVKKEGNSYYCLRLLQPAKGGDRFDPWCCTHTCTLCQPNAWGAKPISSGTKAAGPVWLWAASAAHLCLCHAVTVLWVKPEVYVTTSQVCGVTFCISYLRKYVWFLSSLSFLSNHILPDHHLLREEPEPKMVSKPGSAVHPWFRHHHAASPLCL